MVGSMDDVPVFSTRPKRILLVEDDAAVRRSLQLIFAAQGYEVRAYGSGSSLPRDEEALKADCLVADLVLPETDAIKLLAGLRAAGWEGSAILFSGHLNARVRSQALKAGFTSVFEKPISPAELLKAVNGILQAC